MNINNSNIQISLNDFRSKDVFVLLRETYKDNLLKKAILKAGSQSKLAKLINTSLDYPKIKQAVISSFIYKKNLRLDLVYWLCRFVNINFDSKNILGIKGVKTSRMIMNPRLNIPLTKELAQIVANLYCDGCIEKSNCYTATYYNTHKKLILRFKKNITKTFGEIDLYEGKTNVNVIKLPAFIGKVLYYKFKLYEDKVPSQIINSSQEIKAAYLQAVFDDEGNVHSEHGQIRLKMKPRSYIEDIKKLIQGFNIEISKVTQEIDKRNNKVNYFLTISGWYNQEKFFNQIGFFHPKKKRILGGHLRNIKRKSYGYKAKDLVVNILKKQGPLTVKQISKILDRDKKTVQLHLTNLKKQDRVDYVKEKRKFAYEYLREVKKFSKI